ncbi:MAG: VWA domain-containing protein [candidate division Zixibacteria bacterium]|nr:VWA domain-containing protein [candidate division Zixibacteria bacterium]
MKFEGWDVILFQIPGWFILAVGGVVIIGLAYYYYYFASSKSAAVRYSDLSLVKTGKKSLRQRLRPMLNLLRLCALALLFIAMARPQSGSQKRDIETEGVDIMIALDVSGSMNAEDFKPHNRLYVAKEEIGKFIDRRTNDRIGLLIFAKTSFVQCPLTLDYGTLRNFLTMVDFGQLEDGTAIGLALANSVNRFRDSDAKSKVIILLTDGVNNVTEIDPMTAANVAKTMGVKVYTIGTGKPGNAMYKTNHPIFGVRYQYATTMIDEETLTKIAERTGGRYFRARSEKELEEIYTEIDGLEKTKIKVNEYIQYEELFFNFLLAGFFLMLLEMLLSQTYLRKIP